jgi:hypothetical protein
MRGQIKKVIILLYPLITYGATYYVDNHAPSGGDGSQSHPWQEIQTGLDNVSAGDTLFICGDSSFIRIYEESTTLNFSANGTSSSPIVVKAFPGEKNRN